MVDTPDNSVDDALNAPIDLSELKGLNFGPSWTQSAPQKRTQKSERDRARGPRSSAPRRDRRPPPSRAKSEAPKPFKPIVSALFYPEDAPFNALARALKTSCKTYQLFEIATLILEKVDRFVAVVTPKTGNPEAPEHFYCSVPDHLPFLTEEEAMAHVLRHYVDLFFDVTLVDVEPPKGSFQYVNRCPATGELLGPPNFHRYQQGLQEHYAMHCAHMPFDRFESKLERVEDPELIQSWITKMSQVKHYRLKDRAEGERELFESLESVRFFLLNHRKDKILRVAHTARVCGKCIEKMPSGALRSSIEAELEQQRHFPLQTANNLRGRLRRLKFHLFKKGTKGPAFVCATKRRFRSSDTIFSESIQGLIDFIEKHPDILISDLNARYLGIAREAASADESVPSEPSLTDEQQGRIKQMMQDLHWLITEGYVTEYSDGKLYAPTAKEATLKGDGHCEDEGLAAPEEPLANSLETPSEEESSPEIPSTEEPKAP